MSLARETSVSQEVRWLEDLNVTVSAISCFLELSDDDVDGRGSSGGIDGGMGSLECDNVSSPAASVPCETDGDALDSIVEAGTVLGVRNWVLETACLSAVGTLNAGLVARDNELNECRLAGLGNEIADADKGHLCLSTDGSVDISLLILFCGNESGDGL